MDVVVVFVSILWLHASCGTILIPVYSQQHVTST